MTGVTLPSFAKVNLFLQVVGKRPDGYHDLVTLFERIDLADRLTLEEIPGNRVEIRCGHPDVPTDGTNLAAKAVELYRQAAGWPQGIRITLEKKIPVGAGLGGGSSNAAAALQGLQILSGGRLEQGKLQQIARHLGADVAFFLSPSPWVLGTGRGDLIQPLALKARLWHLLVYPRFPIPTKAVYQAFVSSAGLRAGLTPPGPDVRLLTDALREKTQVREINDLLFNSLEPTVEALFPAIRHVKATMHSQGGLVRPMVSGSGSTVMALCASEEEARVALGALQSRAEDWQFFLASTRV